MLVLCPSVILALVGGAHAAIIRVNPDGSGDATTITAGLALAGSGDEVDVAGGTYTEDVVLPAVPVTLVGVEGSAVTTIIGLGDGSVVTVADAGATGTEVRGFTITGGDCTAFEAGDGVCAGLAVSRATVDLSDLVVTGTVAGPGVELDGVGPSTVTDVQSDENDGGLYLDEDYRDFVTLTDVEASGNTGSGLWLYEADVAGDAVTVEDNEYAGVYGQLATFDCDECTISGNTGNWYAGVLIFDDGWISLTRSTISNNTPGGIGAEEDTSLLLSDDIVSNNYGPSGAGVSAAWGSAYNTEFINNVASGTGGAMSGILGTLDNDRFIGNSAAKGGALAFLGDGGATITNCVFEGNRADSGAVIWGDYETYAVLTNVTAIENTSGDADIVVTGYDSRLTLTNTILAGSTGAALALDPTVVFAPTYSDLHANAGGSGLTVDPTGSFGNIAVDPDFVDYVADGTFTDDLHLAFGSPLIDVGDPALTDPDGTRSDIGAYGGEGAAGWVDGDGDGWSTVAGDCDDANAAVNPAAVEVCDGVDNDCDGTIDEGCPTDSVSDSAVDSGTDSGANTGDSGPRDSADDASQPTVKSGCLGCATGGDERATVPLIVGLLLVGRRRRRVA